MPLFFITREHEGTRSFFIQEANGYLYAYLRSALAGHEGGMPIEAHEIKRKGVPKNMIGRVISEDEAKGLLKKMGAKR